MGMKDEEAVLSRLCLDYRALDSGCCGMAGAFGFEKDHYDVSIKVGERALLPTVRNADKDTLIIADGFSCREQIDQTTDRHALPCTTYSAGHTDGDALDTCSPCRWSGKYLTCVGHLGHPFRKIGKLAETISHLPHCLSQEMHRQAM